MQENERKTAKILGTIIVTRCQARCDFGDNICLDRLNLEIRNTIGTVPFVRLTNTTLRYAIALADKGWQQACKDDSPLAKGLNIIEDKVAYKAVADVFGLEYHPYLG